MMYSISLDGILLLNSKRWDRVFPLPIDTRDSIFQIQNRKTIVYYSI